MCCHPEHSDIRANSILQTLDSLIRSLGFLDLDAGDPRVTRFGDYQVPSVVNSRSNSPMVSGGGLLLTDTSGRVDEAYSHGYANGHPDARTTFAVHDAVGGVGGISHSSVRDAMSMSGILPLSPNNNGALPHPLAQSSSASSTLPIASSTNSATSPHHTHSHTHTAHSPQIPESGCSCTLFKNSSTSPSSVKTTPFWVATPGWNSSWSLAETRFEEQRRLVWSALMLATAHVSYANSLGQPPLDLAITKPWMVRFYFSFSPSRSLY